MDFCINNHFLRTGKKNFFLICEKIEIPRRLVGFQLAHSLPFYLLIRINCCTSNSIHGDEIYSNAAIFEGWGGALEIHKSFLLIRAGQHRKKRTFIFFLLPNNTSPIHKKYIPSSTPTCIRLEVDLMNISPWNYNKKYGSIQVKAGQILNAGFRKFAKIYFWKKAVFDAVLLWLW